MGRMPVVTTVLVGMVLQALSSIPTMRNDLGGILYNIAYSGDINLVYANKYIISSNLGAQIIALAYIRQCIVF